MSEGDATRPTGSVSRRRLLGGMASALATAGLAGCSGGNSDERTTPSDAATGAPAETTTRWTTTQRAENGDARIGMVYALGGLGDNSFNDMAHAGAKKARKEFGISFENAEPSSSEQIPKLQREFASATDPPKDLVCGIGFAQAAGIVSNATEFPDQQFLLVDGVATDESGALLPNVANYTFAEHQGSFQVGLLAGLVTRREFAAGAGRTTGDRTVGFVGGVDVPLIRKFEAGYRAGVARAGDDIEVTSAYAGSFADPDAGERLASEMYADGADIVYHAAGGSGIGVFRAAQKAGRFAIGVDNDQSRSVPEYSDVILASMVKHVDKAVFRSIASLVDRKFRFRVGTVNTLGLLEGGVRAVYGTDLGSAIPDDVTAKLDASRRAIIKNEIKVPTTLS
ncbi:BMP family ABC transporter substrate-binding protein [Halorussus gelatinilyticus]|uniref:BMP family ABC transporter substrate-binding protein n=1 Tax=Halorussus gelatinilyticus TaxID=2937524 RepID=A0A8U0IJT0_9EURY|nr:BMP family ABC transporter substrate-binding protein [Halorussus gelatinilyticus]UPW00552.1 BMP family ABC transporter substrate-binding protein [Halorussus gelatinilyticus]